MLEETSRWDLFLDRLEAGHWTRRILTVVGVIALSAVTFGAGLLLRPSSKPTPAILVIGKPAAMTLNGVSVPDPAAVDKVVRDLNELYPYPDTGINVQSCPSSNGTQYVLKFTYGNGDRWTVIVDRDGCQDVTAGGVWPRTSAFSNPQLLKDLDALSLGVPR
jgi:hypothetical protein